MTHVFGSTCTSLIAFNCRSLNTILALCLIAGPCAADDENDPASLTPFHLSFAEPPPAPDSAAPLTHTLALSHQSPLSLAIGQSQSAAQDSKNNTLDSNSRLRSWELPAVTVMGESPSGLFEEELVGTYRQPRWTATRRFPTTRVYVIPEGKIEVEAWARGTFDEGESKWRFLQEVEVGLGHRLQLDLYLRQDYDSQSDNTAWGQQIEIRYALADWGEIWGNPTLYFEYIILDEGRPDKIEPKLLLGGEIAERWHWGLNLVAELELGGEHEREYQITSGVSYTVIDSIFSIGIENIYTFADVEGDRGNFSESDVIGPSFQWRPIPAFTINIAPLFGITSDSPDAQVWINLSWEF